VSWRIVQITKRAKLDLKLNYLVVRADTVTRIHLSEISTVIIENTAVSITVALMVELAKRKIKVIFCDEKRNPLFENASYYGSHDTSLKIRNQLNWTKNIKNKVWTAIVKDKIRQQMEHLIMLEKEEYKMLQLYMEEVREGDITNREGHAAKVYFNSLFGMGFSRKNDNVVNAALNYGYSIILSAFNREIVSAGYVTQIGISHSNRFNQFNFASDLMEPFRILVDRVVYDMPSDVFEKQEKIELIKILNKEVRINNRYELVNNAIKIYCMSIFDSLDQNDVKLIRFYTDEL
jgi:CRISPR-associated endonuclease Cas1 subtype II